MTEDKMQEKIKELLPKMTDVEHEVVHFVSTAFAREKFAGMCEGILSTLEIMHENGATPEEKLEEVEYCLIRGITRRKKK